MSDPLGDWVRCRVHPWARATAHALGGRTMATEKIKIDPADEFGGVVVGHWLCTGTWRRQTKTGRRVMRCLSHCGVVADYAPHQIGAGLPQTCLGCRSGGGVVPSVSVLHEPQVSSFHKYWEDGMAATIAETSNMKGRDAKDDWNERGRAVVHGVLGRTRFGAGFGWKVRIRDCHERPDKSSRPQLFIRREDAGSKRIEIVVHPRGSRYTFDVDVTTVRTDVPFPEIVRELVGAVGLELAAIHGQEPAAPAAAPTAASEPVPEPEDPPVAPPVAPPEEPVAEAPAPTVFADGPVPIGKLAKLRGNIDQLLAVGSDINELAGLKATAQKRLAAVAARAATALERVSAAEAAANEAEVALTVHKDRVADLDRKLRNATADRDAAATKVEETRAALEAARRDGGPDLEERTAAEREIADLEALEAERLRSIQSREEIMALFRALQKLE